MRERYDHYALKKQISDYLGNHGWKSKTEAKIKLFKRTNHVNVSNIHITVDVLAWKNGKLYIAEIGTLQSKIRKNRLHEIADIFDHLSLDRKNDRGNRKEKWKNVNKVKFVVPDREPMTHETWRVTRRIPCI